MKKEKETRGIGKKHIIIFLVGVLLISGAVSYAYFTGITRTTGTGEVTTSTTVVNANTTLTTEGTLEFNDSDIYPGHKNISTIKVTATGKDEVDYNVIWTGTNSFTTPLNYYVYKTTTEENPSITCNKTTGLVDNMTTYYEVCTESGFDNLGEIVASGEIPTLSESTKVELIKGENIQATEEGNSVYYHVVIEYPNKEEGQNADFNKSINGSVSVEVAEPLLGSDYILAYKNINTRTNFSTILTEDTTGTVYTTEDDDGTSYYFAGAPTDNWVYFGGFYWRIVRINGDNSIRLIYAGNTTNDYNPTLNSSTVCYSNADCSNARDNAYVGYMYTSGELHGHNISSNAKTIIDTWYYNNLKNYEQYIDINAGFCNDRSVISGTGILTDTTIYSAKNRIGTSPSLKCNNIADLFTQYSSIKGNKKLTYPIGVLTADEINFAGGAPNTSNNNYYLYNQQGFFTITPTMFSSGGYALMFTSGLYETNLSNASYTRPVINLRSDITLTGSGTSLDPYIPHLP